MCCAQLLLADIHITYLFICVFTLSVCVLLLFDGEIKIYNVVMMKSCDTSLAKVTPLWCLKIVPNSNRTGIVVVSETLTQLWNAKWLQLRYDSDSTAIRPMFDYHSTAIRRFFFDRATTMRRPIRYDRMALCKIFGEYFESASLPDGLRTYYPFTRDCVASWWSKIRPCRPC